MGTAGRPRRRHRGRETLEAGEGDRVITAVETPQLDLRPAVRAALNGRPGQRGMPPPSLHAVQPVVVTGPVTAPQGGPVVVAVDADAHPGVLQRYGWQLSSHLGVPLRVVYVWTDCRPPDCAHHRTCHPDLADAERLLAALLKEYLPLEAVGCIEREVLHEADPAEALQAISSVGSLLVLGSSSDQPGSNRGTLGSTARSLVGRTACPLILVPYGVARLQPAPW